MPKITTICITCYNQFTTWRSSVSISPVLYCSRKCRYHHSSEVGAAISERFWNKVGTSTDEYGCWEWQAHRDKDGYGDFKHEGKQSKAHRVAYSLSHDDFEPRLQVCHHCDNPPCCRPDHLYQGTQTSNMQDRSIRGRHYGNHKLTDEQVEEIRRAFDAGTYTQTELARIYGVDASTISLIALRKTWMKNSHRHHNPPTMDDTSCP